MKKLISMFMALLMIAGMASAMAEGVTILSTPQQQIEAEPVDMSDVKLGQEIEIEGYGVIKIVSCEWVDRFGHYWGDEWKSGDEAQYLRLVVEILNTQYVNASYIDNTSVMAAFGDGYEFGGWRRQYKSLTSDKAFERDTDKYEIAPLYKGKYAFIVTLPNFVVDSKDPLSITVQLTDEIVLTYHVRK